MEGFKEFTGKSLDEAIGAACSYYDASRERLEIDIVQDAKSGIFGLVGARKAIVRARRVQLRDTVEDILGRSKKVAEVDLKLDVASDDAAQAQTTKANAEKRAEKADKSKPKAKADKSQTTTEDKGRASNDLQGQGEEDKPARKERPAKARTGKEAREPREPRDSREPREQREHGRKGEGRQPRHGQRHESRHDSRHDHRQDRDGNRIETHVNGNRPDVDGNRLDVDGNRAERNNQRGAGRQARLERQGRSERADGANRAERTERNGRHDKSGRDGRDGRDGRRQQHKRGPQGQPSPTEHLDAMPFGDDVEEVENVRSIPLEELDQERLSTVTLEAVGLLTRYIVGEVPMQMKLHEGRVHVHLECDENSGLLIGREGQTLAALQYVTSRIVSRAMDAAVRIQLDAGDYRTRQDEKLSELAEVLAERVRTTGKPHSTRPLSSYHRRIVHVVLQDATDLITRSSGDGPLKRVIIQRKRG